MKAVTFGLLLALLSVFAQAQTEPHEMDHSQHGAPMPANEDTTQDHSQHQPSEAMKQATSMEHSQHEARRIDDKALRDPHAYSDGYDFGPFGKMHMADSMNFSSLMLDHLEARRVDDEMVYGYDLKAWWGRDFDRLILKSDGAGNRAEFDERALELLWGHAIAPYWNSTLGARADSSDDVSRHALALGITGLAPYWFEVDASFYLDTTGRAAFRGDVEYELLLTQKLILQAMSEITMYSRGDAQRQLGGGLSEIGAALRLRYEIGREFAPYLGVEWQDKLGSTAEYARAANQDESEWHAVVGLRLMF